MRNWTILLLGLLLAQPLLMAQSPERVPSRCHIFIDRQFIWTLEMVGGADQGHVPVMNIITFVEGEWDMRPPQVHLLDPTGREAEIDKFSVDTGVPGEPHIVRYLKVHGNSFIGIDLLGEYEGFTELETVSIDLGDARFVLDPIDCLEYETMVQRVSQINLETPDIRQDFSILGIPFKGQRQARRRYY